LPSREKIETFFWTIFFITLHFFNKTNDQSWCKKSKAINIWGWREYETGVFLYKYVTNVVIVVLALICCMILTARVWFFLLYSFILFLVLLYSVTKIRILDASGPPGLPSLLAGSPNITATILISALSFSPDGEVWNSN
jgi:hypothetical protein